MKEFVHIILDNSNWELDTSLWKIFVLELDNFNWNICIGVWQLQRMDVIHWS